MKLYIGSFTKYYESLHELNSDEINIQVSSWKEALIEQLQPYLKETATWEHGLGTTIEIDEDDFYNLCVCALHLEQKKPTTNVYTLEKPDRLYEKWESGLVESKLDSLLYGDVFFPFEFRFTFAYVDPDGMETNFASLISLQNIIKKILYTSETSPAITQAKICAKKLLDIIEDAISQNTLIIQTE